MRPSDCSVRDWLSYFDSGVMLLDRKIPVQVNVAESTLLVRKLGGAARTIKDPSRLEAYFPEAVAWNRDRAARRNADPSTDPENLVAVQVLRVPHRRMARTGNLTAYTFSSPATPRENTGNPSATTLLKMDNYLQYPKLSQTLKFLTEVSTRTSATAIAVHPYLILSANGLMWSDGFIAGEWKFLNGELSTSPKLIKNSYSYNVGIYTEACETLQELQEHELKNEKGYIRQRLIFSGP